MAEPNEVLAENRRLKAENQQRAAELAIVNAVQQRWLPSWTCRVTTTSKRRRGSSAPPPSPEHRQWRSRRSECP